MMFYLSLALLLFLLMVGGIVECTVMSPLTENVYLTTNDPFEDVYVRTILRMDRTTVTKLPILNDDIFLFNLNHSIDDMTGKLTSSKAL
jgi:hypothetical protein